MKILVEIAEATCYEKRAEDIEVIVSLYSTLPDTFAGTPIAFPLFLATKARPIFAKLSSRKNQLGISVSGREWPSGQSAGLWVGRPGFKSWMGHYVVALSKSLHSPCFVFSDKT